MQRQYRLTKDVEYKQVRSRGRSWAHPLLVLYVLNNNLGLNRIGLSVSKRIGHAVVRNRSKRRLREAIRLHWSTLPVGWDLLFITRPPIASASFQEISAAVDLLLQRAGLVVREKGGTAKPVSLGVEQGDKPLADFG
ncbi:MAG: ribonuclease P protein component [Chloroflexi bacterium]|nr:ribonuclease P protein component [Chloroflexota bacterium]